MEENTSGQEINFTLCLLCRIESNCSVNVKSYEKLLKNCQKT